jgi:hypothetical protein
MENGNESPGDFSELMKKRKKKILRIRGSSVFFFPRAKPKKNTENFQPSHEPTEMRIIAVPSGLVRYDRDISTRDVILVPDLFCKPADLSVYEKVMLVLLERYLNLARVFFRLQDG